MFRRFFKTLALSVAFLLMFSLTASLHAQNFFGQIAGNVTDSTGSVVPGATITITNVNTHAARTVNSDASGFYIVTNLPIGPYTVAIAQSGFRGESRSGLNVSADSHLTADFQLQVGSTTESVTVSAVQGETLNTTSGELSHVIDSKQVQNLALNGRNYTQLMTLIPGAVVTNPDIFSVTTSLAANNQSINGNRADSGNLTVDGAFNMVAGSNSSLMNNVGADFIQEVKIDTSNFSAEYGRTSGPAFNIVTKSGTDQFHGSVFEYVRNNLFDARPFFSANKTQLVFNDFGYGVGGPIIKDRLFFFGGEEWKRLRQQQSPTSLTTPSSAILAGNFAGQPQLFYPGTKTPIPGNNISGMITPDGRAIADVFTVENKLGQYNDVTGASGNLIVAPSNPLNFREDIVRLDFRINQNNSIYGRWISDHNVLIDPFGTFSNSGILPTTPTQRSRPGQSYLVAETWTIKPNIINQSQANFSYASQHIPPVGVNWERSTFGFQYQRLYPNGGTYPNGIPAMTFSGTPYAGVQGPNFALNSPTTDIQVSDTVSIVKGNHLIKFGAMVARDRVDQNGRPYYTGNINFNATSNPNTTGNAFADALLGNFASYQEASADPTGHFRFTQPEAFAQDTWKATRQLSLEYGIRWQGILPLYTQGNNMANFVPSVYDPTKAITVNTNGTVVPGSGNPYNGLVRAGDGVPADQLKRVPNINTAAFPLIPAGAPRGLYTIHGAFGPRLGFAYAANDKTVVRGGFGIFYYRPEGNITFSQVNIQPFLSISEFDNGNLGTLGTGAANNTSLQGGINAIDPGFKNPYIEQFSLGVQRQLPKGMLLETTYVGNVGHHQVRQPNINFPTNLATVAANPSYSTNYFNPYKGFGAITQARSDSNSNYNALQAYLSKRTGQVTFTIGYTFAKALGDSQSNGSTLENWQNLNYNYGETNIDRKHAFISTVVWALPTFSGHNAFLREGLGGIQVSAVVRVQSGAFYTVTGNTSTGSRRAQYLGGSQYAKGNRFVLSGHQAQYLNPAAFSAAPNGAFGSAGVGSVVLPSLQQADTTLSKIFGIGEHVNFKLNADVFNVLNHTNYSSLNTTATAGAAFGRLNGAYPNRQMQFGAKLIF
ncbi:TonB-dependent receptor [Edaphobacter dinghuensis]|uniref:TonB-dependent transporter Oar-like beta-barrel domain-containing protein n=1 Tax=Edaphobacter dinghuensis TaxID=1560005 RepID=A0A917LYD2_9BACT|nr:carboxypeptidase-like regulatory domain-containing protein [Edaphobacter dinghuensis]GGG65314.1 hypothetical protein GCM10011585_03710 [Edaphobacter dinghuensis]